MCVCVCVSQVDDAMLMFDKTTNRHRGESRQSSSSGRLPSTPPPLLSGPPGEPPSCGGEPEETTGASLISQSVNLDQDKASLGTSYLLRADR